MSCCNYQKICMFQGDYLRVFVDCVDGEGNPVDVLSASTIRLAVARNVNSSPVFTKDLLTGIVINAPTSFYFDIEESLSEQLTGKYYFEIELVNDQALVYTLMTGQLTVKKTLIRPL